jgi:two-component system LytT family response regulator
MNVLLVDDERLARAELKRLLAEHSDVEIAGEARNGTEAAAYIAELRPDVMFLDIQMPECDGFELLSHIDRAPMVVFTTAYDEYAIRAFEVNALDYLLKPVSPQRLSKTLGRLRSMLAASAAGPSPERVFVKDGERCWFVRLPEIALFESEGNYTRLYFGDSKPLIPSSLAKLELRLDRARFFRASRRHIVNLDFVASAEERHGRLQLVLRDGSKVEVSRRQAHQMRHVMRLSND